MRRWLLVTAAMLMAIVLAGAPLLFSSRPPLPEAPTRMTAMGLVLLEDDAGLYVLGVMNGSRAGSAGIQPGDRLTAVRNTALTSIAQLEELLALQDGSVALPLTLARQDQTVTVNLSLQ